MEVSDQNFPEPIEWWIVTTDIKSSILHLFALDRSQIPLFGTFIQNLEQEYVEVQKRGYPQAGGVYEIEELHMDAPPTFSGLEKFLSAKVSKSLCVVEKQPSHLNSTKWPKTWSFSRQRRFSRLGSFVEDNCSRKLDK